MLINYYLIFRDIKMREKKSKVKDECKQEDSATLAASSIAQYFTSNNWKIVSFFPNSPCAHKNVPSNKEDSHSKTKKNSSKNSHK